MSHIQFWWFFLLLLLLLCKSNSIFSYERRLLIGEITHTHAQCINTIGGMNGVFAECGWLLCTICWLAEVCLTGICLLLFCDCSFLDHTL